MSPLSELKLFVVKIVVVLFAFGILGVLAATSIIPLAKNVVGRTSESVKNAINKDVNKLRLLGAITHNPEVHYRIALILAKKKKTNSTREAIDELLLGLGLIKPDKTIYINKIEELINRLPDNYNPKNHSSETDYILRLKQLKKNKP